MAQPLTQRPFEEPLLALNADKKSPKSTVTRIHPAVVVRSSTRERAQREPDRALVDVTQSRQAQLPLAAVVAPPVEVPKVAAKKKPGQKGYKRSPESIAKQKATLAAKKKASRRKKKRGAVVAKTPLPPGRKKRSPVTSRFVEALSEIMAPIVAELVTAEIRKRLA